MLDLVYLKLEELKKEMCENKKCNVCDNMKIVDFVILRCVDCNKDLCMSCVVEYKWVYVMFDYRIIVISEDDS